MNCFTESAVHYARLPISLLLGRTRQAFLPVYRVRRVFHFRNGAEMFDIKPPLEVGLWLPPDKYVAVPR
jgi:hypothetical protein